MTKKNQTPQEKVLINRYGPVADGIALLFSNYVEVIIHDLHSQSVIYIANNISKRNLREASALDDVEFDQTENTIGPYEKLNWDGQKIRSTSAILRDDAGTAIGMLCINMQISAFEAARDMLDLFLTSNQLIPQPKKLFHDYWQEGINTFINSWLQEQHLSIAILTHAHKRQLIEALYAQGGFKGKSAPSYVANVLNMGRATVFKYLKDIKQQA
jgi:predicted transcriptional regulator YheO